MMAESVFRESSSHMNQHGLSGVLQDQCGVFHDESGVPYAGRR